MYTMYIKDKILVVQCSCVPYRVLKWEVESVLKAVQTVQGREGVKECLVLNSNSELEVVLLVGHSRKVVVGTSTRQTDQPVLKSEAGADLVLKHALRVR